MDGSAQRSDPSVAHILVRGRLGTFVAETCELADDMISATGRWRRAVGANYETFRWGPRSSYSWPLRELREVRWLDHEEAAA